MSTKAIEDVLEAFAATMSGQEKETHRLALTELTAIEGVKVLLRGMFKDRQLDPHPTSDESPEYVLARWCGYVNESEDES